MMDGPPTTHVTPVYAADECPYHASSHLQKFRPENVDVLEWNGYLVVYPGTMPQPRRTCLRTISPSQYHPCDGLGARPLGDLSAIGVARELLKRGVPGSSLPTKSSSGSYHVGPRSRDSPCLLLKLHMLVPLVLLLLLFVRLCPGYGLDNRVL